MSIEAGIPNDAASLTIEPMDAGSTDLTTGIRQLIEDHRTGNPANSSVAVPFYDQITRQSVFLLLMVASAGLLLALAWPMLLGHVYTDNDLGNFHLPLRSFYAQQIRLGEPFDWCPNLYCGFYLTGEGQVGAYHPLHWLLYGSLPLSLAFDLECWLSYPLLMAGVFIFLWRWQVGREAALFGGMVFAFGGFNLLHFVHPNAVAIVAHLPWLLWAIDRMLRTRNPRRRYWPTAAIALLTGSQLLLGYPQFVLLSLLVEAGYVIVLTLHNTKLPKSLAANLARWSAAIVVGILIGGVQFIPTMDAWKHSVRQSISAGASDLAFGTSLHPLNILQLIAPYLFVKRAIGQNTLELSVYVGIAPFVLAAWWLGYGRRVQSRFRLLSMAAVTASLFSLLWAFGQWGPLGWLQENLPGLSSFRLPSRAIFVFQLAMAILAALGLMSLAQRCTTYGVVDNSWRLATVRPRQLWWLLLANAAITLLAPLVWSDYISSWPLLLSGPLMLAAAIWLVNRAATGARWALAALVLFSAIDLGIYGLSSSILHGAQPLAEYSRGSAAPPGRPIGRVAVDLLAGSEAAPGQKQLRTGDRILLEGWRRVDGYAGLEPARQLDYRQPAALRAANVYWISTEAATQIEAEGQLGWLAKTDRKQSEPNHPDMAAGNNTNWLRLRESQPRAWLVTKMVDSRCPASDIAKISLNDEALVESDCAHKIAASETPGTLQILSDRPGEFVADVNCPASQLLAICESFHPGWQLAIDGQAAGQGAVLRVNGDFLGVIAPAGRHKISIIFRPESLRLGRLSTAFGLGLMVVTLLLSATCGGLNCKRRSSSIGRSANY